MTAASNSESRKREAARTAKVDDRAALTDAEALAVSICGSSHPDLHDATDGHPRLNCKAQAVDFIASDWLAARVAEAVEQERERYLRAERERNHADCQLEQERAARLALVAKVEALITGPTAEAWRDEAARGTAELPYASNRYVRLVDDLRALLAEHPAPAPEAEVAAGEREVCGHYIATIPWRTCTLTGGHAGSHEDNERHKWVRLRDDNDEFGLSPADRAALRDWQIAMNEFRAGLGDLEELVENIVRARVVALLESEVDAGDVEVLLYAHREDALTPERKAEIEAEVADLNGRAE